MPPIFHSLAVALTFIPEAIKDIYSALLRLLAPADNAVKKITTLEGESIGAIGFLAPNSAATVTRH